MGIEINYQAERLLGHSVYEERQWIKAREARRKNHELIGVQSTGKEWEQAQELKEKLSGVTVSISPESIEYRKEAENRKRALRLAYEEIQKQGQNEDQENPFGGMNTYCAVFTDALSKAGCYENRSDDEVLEMENLLIGITHEMNQLFGEGMKVEYSDNEQISSYAAKFELESSTAALRTFADRYVSADAKKSFDRLIDQYYDYNAKKLQGYRSSKEVAHEMRAELLDRTAHHPARVRPLSEWEQMAWIAGKVKADPEEETLALEEWRKCFAAFRFGGERFDAIAGRMGEALTRFASGNSENPRFLSYVEQWNKAALEHAGEYWSKLCYW